MRWLRATSTRPSSPRCGTRGATSTWRSSWRCPPAASAPCSAPRAPARPRSCGSSPASSAARGRCLGEAWQDDERGVFVPVHRRSVGCVFQAHPLLPHLSVAGNLVYGRKRGGRGGRVDRDLVVGLLGIAPLLDRRVDGLSGGERQRVAMAQAILAAPRVLLLDEPLAALDAARKLEILPYLERLRDELAIPIVFVSHAMDEVARIADHLVLLEGGRVVAS